MISAIIVRATAYDDPVWGLQITDWVATPPIRVTRNNARRAHFEWVGGREISGAEWAGLVALYPLVKYWEPRRGATTQAR